MNKKLLFIILYLYALVFSVLKTIRFPNGWSEAHWMMDYRLGFIKRGLAGAFFGFFFERNEQSILFLSSVILLTLYGLLISIAYRETLRNRGNIYTVLLYLLFFLSQYIIFSAHLIGYLDHLIFLLTILVIWLLRKRMIILSSLLVSISILIHEVSFFLMLPICCFALVVNEIDQTKLSPKNILSSGLIKKMIMFLVLPLAITCGVSIYQEVLGRNNYNQIFNYLDHLKFIDRNVAKSVASAYTIKFTVYFNEESPRFFQRIFASKCSVFFGIPILFMMYLVYKQFERVNRCLLLLLAVIILIPLCLHAIAYDNYRIWSFPFIILFLGFWILNSKVKAKSTTDNKMSMIEVSFAIVSFLLISLVPSYLMDNEVERFSTIQRVMILIPLIILGIYYFKKAPIKGY
ncbi:hypothetical protein [Chryseobacterium paridis]|uniref:EpsG family protein n=1 Tax=Chryseobacterium paridis TaxID=2800328 RepID=A0ABS1FUP8_9FLAO|nr:hypothetical protein [Chryseobacterium paridis]MBK1895954.1 hypothetical protein [Chryseobacterium paridis]